MIIGQFRNYSPINIVYLGIISVVLSIGFFFNLPQQLPSITFEPLLHRLIPIELKWPLSSISNILLTVSLTFLQALMFNRINTEFNLLAKPNYLTALLFVTLASAIPPFLILSPALICNIITIWMLNRLFSISKMHDVKSLMFDLGLIVALGTLIYFPFIMMLPLVWISLLIFRTFYWREWIAPLLGYCIVYFLLGTVYYWLDQSKEFLSLIIPNTKQIPDIFGFQIEDYFIIIPIIIILVFFVFTLREHFYKNVVHLRKSFQLVFYMLCLIIGSFFLFEGTSVDHFLLCVPGLSIYMAYFFTHAKNRWIFEGLFIILFIGICFLQTI